MDEAKEVLWDEGRRYVKALKITGGIYNDGHEEELGKGIESHDTPEDDLIHEDQDSLVGVDKEYYGKNIMRPNYQSSPKEKEARNKARKPRGEFIDWLPALKDLVFG